MYSAGVRAVTLGQYLKPAWNKMAVDRYASEEQFEHYGRVAKQIGFEMVASGPMVRSSYRAGELFLSRLIDKRNKERGVFGLPEEGGNDIDVRGDRWKDEYREGGAGETQTATPAL